MSEKHCIVQFLFAYPVCMCSRQLWLCMYTGLSNKKLTPDTFINNFDNFWPIFTVLDTKTQQWSDVKLLETKNQLRIFVSWRRGYHNNCNKSPSVSTLSHKHNNILFLTFSSTYWLFSIIRQNVKPVDVIQNSNRIITTLEGNKSERNKSNVNVE